MINWERLTIVALEGLYAIRPTDPFEPENFKDVCHMDEQLFAEIMGWA